jgi:mannosidase alpha-like ER degradation enhancer 1
MNWGWYWRGLVVAVILASGFLWFHSTDAANPLSGSSSWTPQRKLAARWVDYHSGCCNLSVFSFREKVRELWHHGFDNYMTYGMW